MVGTLVIYESIHGFTTRIANSLALILGPARCCRTAEFQGDHDAYDTVVICAPVYSDIIDGPIRTFVADNADWLITKKVVLVCTCLVESRANEYLLPLSSVLGKSVVLQAALGGELILHQLSNSDRDTFHQFCGISGVGFRDYNLYKKHQFINLVRDIHRIQGQGRKVMEKSLLTQYIDAFLKSHNTCTLATGYDENIRATPMEYTYLNRHIYFLSEGGEKFSNLLINPHVSVCVYDSYKNREELAGMQITGIAQCVQLDCEEYYSVVKHQEIIYEKIAALPFTMHLIKINIDKIEFLSAEFKKLGYDIKQTFLYK